MDATQSILDCPVAPLRTRTLPTLIDPAGVIGIQLGVSRATDSEKVSATNLSSMPRINRGMPRLCGDPAETLPQFGPQSRLSARLEGEVGTGNRKVLSNPVADVL